MLADDAVVVVYGPFNVDGRPTSPGNAAFDASLRSRAAHMGVRDVDAVDSRARAAGLSLVGQRLLPANNRCLVWHTVRSRDAGPDGD